MECFFAVSEVAAEGDSSLFGGVAEEIIYSDFRKQYSFSGFQIFQDHYNIYGYLTFLGLNNKNFNDNEMIEMWKLRGEKKNLFKIPDILIHTPSHKRFYEIKPNSDTGRSDGEEKVTFLYGKYQMFDLPYVAGVHYVPQINHRIAFLGSDLIIDLHVSMSDLQGLILYNLRVQSRDVIDNLRIKSMLAWVVKELNLQRKSPIIRPINLGLKFNPTSLSAI